MLPHSNTPSMFLVGTDNERLFSHLHHPFEKEQFSLVEEAKIRRVLQAPDKVAYTWIVDASTKLCAKQQPYVFCTSNRIGVFTFRLSSNSTTFDFFNIFSALLISAWIHVPVLLWYRPRVIRLPLKR